MSELVTFDQVMALASRLPPAERKRLAAQLLNEKEESLETHQQPRRRLWRDLRGIVAYPMCGEDAQAWVTRTRRDADEHRERQSTHFKW
jgi:hypothetical protein